MTVHRRAAFFKKLKKFFNKGGELFKKAISTKFFISLSLRSGLLNFEREIVSPLHGGFGAEDVRDHVKLGLGKSLDD